MMIKAIIIFILRIIAKILSLIVISFLKIAYFILKAIISNYPIDFFFFDILNKLAKWKRIIKFDFEFIKDLEIVYKIYQVLLNYKNYIDKIIFVDIKERNKFIPIIVFKDNFIANDFYNRVHFLQNDKIAIKQGKFQSNELSIRFDDEECVVFLVIDLSERKKESKKKEHNGGFEL